jgi:D-aminoacyl-tRNA deacylase
MRAVIQRVKRATVTINHGEKRSIGPGLLVFLGIEDADDMEDVVWLSGKISRLRIFNDENQLMNKSIADISGSIMLISQFTLHASTRKGNRPSFIRAARPEIAIPLYEKFIAQIEQDIGTKPVAGEFGAYMEIELLNDGPVTIWVDSKNRE